MSFEPIRRILVRSIPSSPVSKDIQIARVFEAWRATLVRSWGEEKAAFITPVSFNLGVLKIASTSPAAKQQLSIELPRMKNELNRALGELVVKQIVILSKGF